MEYADAWCIWNLYLKWVEEGRPGKKKEEPNEQRKSAASYQQNRAPIRAQ